jgi:hypothetical protein
MEKVGALKLDQKNRVRFPLSTFKCTLFFPYKTAVSKEYIGSKLAKSISDPKKQIGDGLNDWVARWQNGERCPRYCQLRPALRWGGGDD